MRRCLLALLALAAVVPAARAQSPDATALFLLTQRHEGSADTRAAFSLDVPAEAGDPPGRVTVEATFAATAPCRYRLQVLRRLGVGGTPASEAWSQVRIDFTKADRLEFKPLFDDHGPATYLILGRPGLMCVRDAVMADCADRITVEEDPRRPFDPIAIREAFARMRGFCPAQPS